MEDVNRKNMYKICKEIPKQPEKSFTAPGVWGSQISRQFAREGDEVVSPRHRPPLPSRRHTFNNFCQKLSRSPGHSAAGKIKSMKNLNRTRDLLVFSTAPQPTARTSLIFKRHILMIFIVCSLPIYTVNWGLRRKRCYFPVFVCMHCHSVRITRIRAEVRNSDHTDMKQED